MADSEQEREQTAGLNHRAPPGVPTWVKALLVILAAVILVMVIAHLTGHGPTHMRH